MKKEQKGWAVVGVYGLYIGWNFTRREAIEHHTKLLGKSWEYCKKKGDKCIKVVIHYEEPK